jgi:purine-binding chemotaxis protein CheW
MEHQFVIFRLGEEDYGVDIAAVESIIKMQAITGIPKAPEFIEGVTNLRDSVIPILDLRKRFSLDKVDLNADSRIVVITMRAMKVGMIVDAVSEVLQIDDTAIEPPSPMTSSIDTAFITGIAKVGERLVILLDLERVLSVTEKSDLEALPEIV